MCEHVHCVRRLHCERLPRLETVVAPHKPLSAFLLSMPCSTALVSPLPLHSSPFIQSVSKNILVSCLSSTKRHRLSYSFQICQRAARTWTIITRIRPTDTSRCPLRRDLIASRSRISVTPRDRAPPITSTEPTQEGSHWRAACRSSSRR